MRWLVGLLVLLNVTLFLWATGHRQPVHGSYPEPRVAINADSMRLLEGPAAGSGDRRRAGDEGTAAVPKKVAGGGNCYTVGPFTLKKTLSRAKRALGELRLSYRERRLRDSLIEGYRVLVGPLPSVQAAQALRQRLTDLGVTDHYIIESGLENAIALGFFSELDKAEKFVHQLKTKGVDAHLKVRSRKEGTLRWLEVSGGKGRGTMQILKQKDWGEPKINVRRRPCR